MSPPLALVRSQIPKTAVVRMASPSQFASDGRGIVLTRLCICPLGRGPRIGVPDGPATRRWPSAQNPSAERSAACHFASSCPVGIEGAIRSASSSGSVFRYRLLVSFSCASKVRDAGYNHSGDLDHQTVATSPSGRRCGTASLHGRTAVWKCARPKSGESIDSFIGCRYRPVTNPLTIEEIAEIAAEDWAGSPLIITVDTNVVVQAALLDDREQARRGGEVFASFDRTPIRLIAEAGDVTHLLSGEQPQPSG